MSKRRLKKIYANSLIEREFVRASWKHFLRWLGFAVLCFLICGLVINLINISGINHKPFQVKDLVAYFLVCLLVILLVPSVVFEVNKVKINEQGIYLANLLFARQEKWEDIMSINSPFYLKFSILRTKKLFYLLNKQDLPEVNDLITLIKNKIKPKIGFNKNSS